MLPRMCISYFSVMLWSYGENDITGIMGSAESKPTWSCSEDEKEGSKKGGNGDGHSRSYPNRVQTTGYAHLRGEGKTKC